ncbi:MAG: carboxypeptidase-like regulatory domain-containing protein [Bacteroidales bacterium]
MKRYYFIIVPFLFLAQIISGQDFYSVTGRVQDATTGKALNFASIQLISTNISNVTNSEGLFVLKIPSNVKADSIMVSYLGYKSKRVSLKEFGREPIKIKLEQSDIALNPITIRPQDAPSIVKMALARISRNYKLAPVQVTAFYREMIKKGNTYVSINEAVLDINKASYAGYRADQLAIYKARGSYDINRIDTLLVKFQGGPNSAMDLDIVKDPFLGADIMMLEQIYKFNFTDPVTINNRFFYVIEFDELVKQREIYFRGKIFIDAESLAVGRIEFAMNVENRELANSYFVRKKPASLKMDVMSAYYLVNYKLIDGLWYFDYSKTEVKFNAKWDKKWFRNIYTISSEIAITDISENERKIEVENRIKPRDIMSTKVSDYTDENFWEDYNIIEPDQSIENVISRIIKQLRKRE